ncbi:MAG: hypothetical protein ACUVUS_06935 [Thermoproteota archaeon]
MTLGGPDYLARTSKNKSSTYTETEFRKSVAFEYDANTERFYRQKKDVGVLLPMF